MAKEQKGNQTIADLLKASNHMQPPAVPMRRSVSPPSSANFAPTRLTSIDSRAQQVQWIDRAAATNPPLNMSRFSPFDVFKQFLHAYMREVSEKHGVVDAKTAERLGELAERARQTGTPDVEIKQAYKDAIYGEQKDSDVGAGGWRRGSEMERRYLLENSEE